MSDTVRILVFGASYGSLLATKLLMAGHRVTLVCLPEEAGLINREGTVVRLPVRGRDTPLVLRSADLPGRLDAVTTTQARPQDYDLVALAMQEPQYAAPGVRELLGRVAEARVPCMSIMNMPPLPFLARVPGLDTAKIHGAFTDPACWEGLVPGLVTLASPDPQAFRPPEEGLNVLQVGLPTNFKVAPFEDPAHTDLLHRLAADIDAVRWEGAEVPVKLRVHDSLFVPMAKWAMLLTGNYRAIQPGDPRSIRDAVHSDLELSRQIYGWVCDVCEGMGARPEDLVPFEKYARAAEQLGKPSSAARALAAGAPRIERVDRLVQLIAAGQGKEWSVIDQIVDLVDAKLEQNRVAA